MDRPVASDESAQKTVRSKPAHLVCGFRLRAVAAAAVCFYFSYSNYLDVRDRDFHWDHEVWTIITWAVWLLLIAGVFSETRCLRERILGAATFASCAVGLILSAWSSAPFKTMRHARELALAFWILAFMTSLSTFFEPKKDGVPEKDSQ